ncbi:MAG: hypothetical protein NXI31_09720 [bacterium]|nr:hypothetical protein [bacterium]
MFPDSLLLNLALFVAGQAAAWFYLRSGRLLVGGLATAAIWIAADWAVVARYVFEDLEQFRIALIAMQLVCVGIVGLLAFAQWRRRWSGTAKRRAELFEAGTAAYLRDAHDEARATYQRLVRCDPWDAAAWLALGNVHRRADRRSAARRCYRRCLRVDTQREYTDLARQLSGRG